VVLAASVLGDQASFFLGSMGALVPLIVLFGSVTVVATLAPDGSRRAPAGHVYVVALAFAALLLLMFTVMIQRHPPVAQVDVRRGYYGLPALVLVLFGSLVLLDRLAGVRRARPFVNAFLLAITLVNLAALPEHARISVTNHVRDATLDSPAILDVLRTRQWKPGYPELDARANFLLKHYATVLPK
jgi:hypothetical protein